MSTPNYVDQISVLSEGTQHEIHDTESRERLDVLEAAYQALSESEIIVGALPSTGQANKIYRVPNDPTTGKYSDYMYNAGALTTPVLMATYDVGGDIDDKLDTITDAEFNEIFN